MSVKFNGKEYNVKYNKGISSLTLIKKKITNIIEIEGLETLEDLIELNLSNNAITEIKGLENLVNLKVLNLSYNAITEIKGLESLDYLKVLNLNNNIIKEIKGLETLTNLERLKIRYNKIKILKGLDTLENLKFLDLGYNLISQVESLPQNLSTLGNFYTGNPIRTMLDRYGVQNLKEYINLSKEQIKVKNFPGYQFSIKNASIIQKSDVHITFSTFSGIIKIIPSKPKESGSSIIPKIEKCLTTLLPVEDSKEENQN